MSKFSLPSQKGTQLFPDTIIAPPITRWVGVDARTSEAQTILDQYGSAVTSFYMQQAHNHSLSNNNQSRGYIQIAQNLGVEYVNQFGKEFITLYVRPSEKPIVSEQEEKIKKESNVPYMFVGINTLSTSTGNPYDKVSPFLFQKNGREGPEGVLHMLSVYGEAGDNGLIESEYLYNGPEFGYALPENRGNGLVLIESYYDAQIGDSSNTTLFDPVDKKAWEFAFVWDPLDEEEFKLGIAQYLEWSDQQMNEMMSKGPKGPYAIKINFDQPHCDKESASGEYIAIIGRGSKRQTVRGTFEIEAGSDFYFLTRPYGFRGSIDGYEIQHQPRRGSCDVVFDDGENPHWKNWWQGSVIVNPTPLLTDLTPAEAVNAGAIEERPFFIPESGFNTGSGPNPDDYATYCEPCPIKAIYKYVTAGYGSIEHSWLQVDTSSIIPADGLCPGDVLPGSNGGRAPPMKNVIYVKARFEYTASVGTTTTIRDRFVPGATGSYRTWANYFGITDDQIRAMVPANIPISGPLVPDSPFANESIYPSVQIPTNTTSWFWSGNGLTLPTRYSLTIGYKAACGFPFDAWFQQTEPAPDLGANFHILSMQPPTIYNNTGFLFITSNAYDESSLTLLEATGSQLPPRNNSTIGSWATRSRLNIMTGEFVVFGSTAEMQADYAAKLLDDDVITSFN